MRSLLVGLLLASSACWDTTRSEPVNVIVDLAERPQRIDGFSVTTIVSP